MTKKLMAILVAGLLVLPAIAEEGQSYLNFQIASHQLEISGLDGSGSDSPKAGPTAYNIKLGAYVTDHLALEVAYSGPMGDDTFDDSEINIELHSLFALGLSHDFVTYGPVRLFAKTGLVRVAYKGDNGLSATEKGLMWGTGISLDVSERTRFNFEYTLLPDVSVENSDEDIDSGVVGFGLIFDL